MAYIMPGTEVYLCENNESDPSYQNTLYFSGEVMQKTHIQGCAHYHFTNFSYQRVNRNTIRVGIGAEELYAKGINYMAFQNASFGSKWFYAFVTRIEYVNNDCSNITFEIDELQTWLIATDAEILPCMIDRMTVLSDGLGEHIEPESIATGEYVFNDYNKLDEALDNYYCCVQVADSDFCAEHGIDGVHRIDGMTTGVATVMFKMEEDDRIKAFLDQFTTTPDNIVGMYAVPQANAAYEIEGEYVYFRLALHGATYIYRLPGFTVGVDGIDGYIPRNNKLYTYPFNFLQVNNGTPETLTLRYEFWGSTTSTTASPSLYTISNVSPPVEVVVYPYGYKGATGVMPLNTECLTLTNFPLLSWNVDTYKVYQANQQTIGSYELGKVAGNVAFNAAQRYVNKEDMTEGSVERLASAGLEMGQSFFNYAMDKKLEDYNASVSADIAKGNTASGAVRCSNGMQNFFYGRMSVTRQYAEVIDSFFDRYGYHIGKVEQPQITGREHWMYLKTMGALVKGKMPMEDRLAVQRILDNGVTFWQKVGSWGNYSLENYILR